LKKVGAGPLQQFVLYVPQERTFNRDERVDLDEVLGIEGELTERELLLNEAAILDLLGDQLKQILGDDGHWQGLTSRFG